MTNEQRVTRLTRIAALRDARLEGRESALPELPTRYARERIAELQDVHDVYVLRRALDESIEQAMSGKRQGVAPGPECRLFKLVTSGRDFCSCMPHRLNNDIDGFLSDWKHEPSFAETLAARTCA